MFTEKNELTLIEPEKTVIIYIMDRGPNHWLYNIEN